MKYSIRKRLKSFGFAFTGIKTMLIKEPNARIHVFAIVIAVVMGVVFNISSNEWGLICLSIGVVFSLEIINTAIEDLADIISLEKDEKIKKIKDLSAAAVLIAAIAALVVGIIIFLPKIIAYVNGI